MSIHRDISTGTTTIYNEQGMCTIPKDVREELGIEVGDEIKLIAQGDEAVVFPLSKDAEEKNAEE